MTRLARTPALPDNAADTAIGEPMTTPGDLAAMRNLLGLSRLEMGALLGGLKEDLIRNLERSRNWVVSQAHADLLTGMLAKFNAALDAAMDQRPAFLITFPNDGAFKDYEPDLAAWMHFNSVHRMFIARLLDALIMEGHKPEVMELVPADYDRYLASIGFSDSPTVRIEWAKTYRKKITMRPGLPGQKKDTE